MRPASTMRPPAPDAAPTADDFTRIPFLIGAIDNVLSNGGSRMYRRAFNIGLGEWRLMWVLAVAPNITARRAAQIMGADEAAVSRALAGLQRRCLVSVAGDPRDRRQRRIALSEAGVELHGRIILVARERERRLLASFRKDEIRQLSELLRRLHAAAPSASAFDPAAFLAATAAQAADD